MYDEDKELVTGVWLLTELSKFYCKLQMARGKRKNVPKLKILAVLKSGHQIFLENALSESNFSKEENETP